MITAKVQSVPPIKNTPPISFPFLWKGHGGRVCLRVRPIQIGKGDVDACLINADMADPVDFGQMVYTGLLDNEAWAKRLSDNEAVILSNV